MSCKLLAYLRVNIITAFEINSTTPHPPCIYLSEACKTRSNFKNVLFFSRYRNSSLTLRLFKTDVKKKKKAKRGNFNTDLYSSKDAMRIKSENLYASLYPFQALQSSKEIILLGQFVKKIAGNYNTFKIILVFMRMNFRNLPRFHDT